LHGQGPVYILLMPQLRAFKCLAGAQIIERFTELHIENSAILVQWRVRYLITWPEVFVACVHRHMLGHIYRTYICHLNDASLGIISMQRRACHFTASHLLLETSSCHVVVTSSTFH